MRRAGVIGFVACACLLAFADSAAAAPPANDGFAAAQVISADGGATAGDTREATREGGEPDHNAAGGIASVWYSISPTFTGGVEIDVCDADFATAVAAYQGPAFGSLTELDSGDCRIGFPVVSGQSYRVAVDGAAAARGRFTLRLERRNAPGNDGFAGAEALTGSDALAAGDNRGASREAGEPDHAPGHAASIWYRWTAPYSGGVHVEVCESDEQVVSIYTGASLGALQLVERRSCALWFTVTGATEYWIAIDGARAAFTLELQAIEKLLYDDFVLATDLVGESASISGDNRGASREAGEPTHGTGGGDASVWHRWTAPQTGAVEIDVCDADFDADVALYTGGTVGTLTQVAAPSDCILRAAVTGGIVYSIAVQTHGETDERGSYTIRLTAAQKPANDDFALPQDVTGASALVSGDTRGASREVNEPQHFGVGSGSVWYRWVAPLSGRARVDACGESDDDEIRIAAYTGTAFANFVKRAGEICTIVFPTVAGTTYYVAVEGEAGDHGSFALRFQSGLPVPNDDFANAQVLSGDNVSVSGENLLATHQSGEPSGVSANGASVWFAWTAPYSGFLNVNTCGSDRSLDTALYMYQGTVMNMLTTRGVTFGNGGGCNTGLSPVSVTAGVQYRFKVDASPAQAAESRRRGNYTLNLHLRDLLDPQTTITTPAPAGVVNQNGLAIEFTSSEPGSTFECSVDSTTSFSDCSSPRTLTGLSDGSHTFRVRARDLAGNTDSTPAALTFTVDATPPQTTILEGPDTPSSDTTPTFRYFSSEPGSRFECRIDSAAFADCNGAPGGGRADAEATPTVAEGEHTFEVRAIDAAGNPDPTPDSRTFVVDATGPTVSIDSAPTDPTDQTPTFRYSASQPGSTFTCQIDDGPLFACSGPSSDPASQAELTTVALADGTHGFALFATDEAGNAGPVASVSFTIDRSTPPPDGGVAPETVIGKGPKPKLTTRAPAKRVTFSFSSTTAGATFECALQKKRRNRKPGPPSYGPCTSPKTYKKKPGTYTFFVRAVAGGLTDATPAKMVFQIVAAAVPPAAP